MSDGVTVVLGWGGLDDELATRFGGAETFRASHCLIKTIQYFAQTTADCYTGQSCFTEGPRSQLAFIPAVTGQIRALYRRKAACGGGSCSGRALFVRRTLRPMSGASSEKHSRAHCDSGAAETCSPINGRGRPADRRVRRRARHLTSPRARCWHQKGNVRSVGRRNASPPA